MRRLTGIELVDDEVEPIGSAEGKVIGVDAVSRGGHAVVAILDDGVSVEAEIDSGSNGGVGGHDLVVVEPELLAARNGLRAQNEFRGGFELGAIGDRGRLGEVNVARLERSRQILAHDIVNLVDKRLSSPVILEAHKRLLHIGFGCLYHVRTGIGGILVEVDVVALREIVDHEHGVAQRAHKAGLSRGKRHFERRVVHCLHGGNRERLGCQSEILQGAFKAALHGLGGKLVAVLEGHVVA